MFKVTTQIESVDITLDADGAQSLLDVLSAANLSLDDPQVTMLRANLENLFGGSKNGERKLGLSHPRRFPPVTFEVPRTSPWNVFEVRSHLYTYLKEKGFEYLRSTTDIAIKYSDNQEALVAQS